MLPKLENIMPDQPIDFLRFAENGNLYGFASAHPILRLRQEGVRELPDQPGVYMVFTPAGFTPDFLPKSIARPRKGKPATISVELLRNKHWVPGSRVIYIGKAGG